MVSVLASRGFRALRPALEAAGARTGAGDGRGTADSLEGQFVVEFSCCGA